MQEEPISKSQRKREMHALQDLGERLVALNPKRLRDIPLSDKLLEAIHEMHRLTSHEAKRRQLQYVGRLMRSVETLPIETALAKFDQTSDHAKAKLHQLEKLREQFLTEPKATLTKFVAKFPDCDVQHLRHLIRDALREREKSESTGEGRVLLRYLRSFFSEK